VFVLLVPKLQGDNVVKIGTVAKGLILIGLNEIEFDFDYFFFLLLLYYNNNTVLYAFRLLDVSEISRMGGCKTRKKGCVSWVEEHESKLLTAASYSSLCTLFYVIYIYLYVVNLIIISSKHMH
jgi:hypothetical protein